MVSFELLQIGFIGVEIPIPVRNRLERLIQMEKVGIIRIDVIGSEVSRLPFHRPNMGCIHAGQIFLEQRFARMLQHVRGDPICERDRMLHP